MKPVLFLDIDGVLNTTRTPLPIEVRFGHTGIIGFSEDIAHKFMERPLVERLATLVAAAGCDIVFHTSWIYQWSTSELVTFLQRAGFDENCCFDSTQAMGGREHRIRMWLAANGERPFAVLDDCWSDREFPTQALGRLVHVEPGEGLQPRDMEKARRLMAGWEK